MTAAPEGVLEKIRKCLKLAASNSNATEAEASTAMAMARKLMDQHNIEMSDVDIKKEVATGAQEVPVTDKPKAFTPLWEMAMALVCNELFGTQHFYRHRGSGSWTGKTTVVVFVGVGQDPLIAKEAYTILCGLVRKMGSKKGYSGSVLRDYCLGVTRTLIRRAGEIAAKSKGQTQPNRCTDLVVVKDQLIKAHLDSKNLQEARASNARCGAEYQQGLRDGQTVNLDFRRAIK